MPCGKNLMKIKNKHQVIIHNLDLLIFLCIKLFLHKCIAYTFLSIKI